MSLLNVYLYVHNISYVESAVDAAAFLIPAGWFHFKAATVRLTVFHFRTMPNDIFMQQHAIRIHRQRIASAVCCQESLQQWASFTEDEERWWWSAVDGEIWNIPACLDVLEEGRAWEWQGYAEVPFSRCSLRCHLKSSPPPPPPPLLIHEISKPTQSSDRGISSACVSVFVREWGREREFVWLCVYSISVQLHA